MLSLIDEVKLGALNRSFKPTYCLFPHGKQDKKMPEPFTAKDSAHEDQCCPSLIPPHLFERI